MTAFTLPERIALPRVQEQEEVESREDQGASSKGKPAGVRCRSVEPRGATAAHSGLLQACRGQKRSTCSSFKGCAYSARASGGKSAASS